MVDFWFLRRETRMVSILNQAAIDALCSATYLEHYLDCVDDLPSDLQRIVSTLRELDCLTGEVIVEVKRHYDLLHMNDAMSETANSCSDRKRLAMTQLQRTLGRMQEIGDQKLALVAEIIERVEVKTRQLEQNVENLATVGVIKEEDVNAATLTTGQSRQAVLSIPGVVNTSEASCSASPAPGKILKAEEKIEIASAVKMGKRTKRHRTLPDNPSLDKEEKKIEEDEKISLRKKKVKRDKSDNQSPINSKLHIDPNEPTYCLCQQVSYGEMIGCDNEHCPIEWFHFDCVRLTHKPKGKWYCPRCRGARPNIINPELLTEQQQKRADKVSLK